MNPTPTLRSCILFNDGCYHLPYNTGCVNAFIGCWCAVVKNNSYLHIPVLFPRCQLGGWPCSLRLGHPLSRYLRGNQLLPAFPAPSPRACTLVAKPHLYERRAFRGKFHTALDNIMMCSLKKGLCGWICSPACKLGIFASSDMSSIRPSNLD